MRRHLGWLISVPLALVGTLAGHAIGYRVAVPDAHERAQVLTTSGHGYLDHAPLLVALFLALVAIGFVGMSLEAFRGRDTSGGLRGARLVASLAPVVFVMQELIERFAAGHVDWGFVVSAPFLVGLAMQLPFALLAAAIAYAFASTALKLGAAVADRRRARLRGITVSFEWLAVDLPREPVLARGYAGRGPPPYS